MYSFYDFMQDGGQPLWHAEWYQDPYKENAGPAQMTEDDMLRAMDAQNVAANMGRLNPVVPQLKVADRSYKGPSIVDFLGMMGYATDRASRKKLAENLGIQNYTGTAEQNTRLLNMLQDNVMLLSDMEKATEISNTLRSSKKTAAKPKVKKMEEEQDLVQDLPSFMKIAESAYLAAHPGMTPERYREMISYGEDQGTRVSATDKPAKGKGRLGAYDDTWMLNRIAADPRTDRNINREKQKDFAIDLAAGTLLPWLAEGALMAATTRYLPYGLKELPQFVKAASNAAGKTGASVTKALPRSVPRGFEVVGSGLRSPGYPMYKGGGTWSGNTYYGKGGPVVGDEMEVTPEQLEQLRSQGYQFEMI